MIFGIGVIIFVLFFIWQPSQLTKAKQNFIISQTNILKTLSPSIIQNILSNDLAELHRVFENSLIIHKNQWRYVQLIDTDDKQLYPIFSTLPEQSKTLLKIKIDITENDELFGVLILHTDWEDERNKEIENINKLSVTSIILFGIIAVISFILETKWIYIPITRLRDVTKKFSQGNYQAHLPSKTGDEIGVLTSSIDDMRNKIQATLDELKNKEKMQRAILETAPDAIITMNEKGIVNSFNPGAEIIFQYRADEVVGKNIKVLMSESIAEKHDEYISSFNYDESSPMVMKEREVIGRRKDSSEFSVELNVNAGEIDGELLFTGILRDITERKKVDRLKDEFVSTVSHELRTPLTAIKGSLELVTNGLNLDLPEAARSMLDIANRNVKRLLTLINDILDVSKLESGEINFVFDNIEIKNFLSECISINQEYAKEHNTVFELTRSDDNIWVCADKDRLQQVLSNLLSNAAKYSPENISVEISTEVLDGAIHIYVRDFGPGVPVEFRDKLFEKFTQSSSGDTRRVGGTGLGLNISQMIVNRLGGQIGFRPNDNNGSIFYVTLPIVEKTNQL